MEIKNITFKANISPVMNLTKKFIQLQEGSGNLSHVRFIQDSAIGLAPKAVFARTKADLAENSFLELAESGLVYYVPSLLGNNIFKKMYSKGLNSEQQKNIVKPAAEFLKKNLSASDKKLLRVKAAISLGCLAIPICEYSLSYIKNLFTLGLFKTGEFNNIANLTKSKANADKRNEHVKNSAFSHIKKAAALYGGILGASLLFAKKGNTSKLINNISEFILAPGSKLFKNSIKKASLINKYFGLDFANKNGKLAMSHGQLTSCVLLGGLGYFGAAKDRGKQNFLEVASTFPLVGSYIICGNEFLENMFKKFLYKKNLCKDVLKKDLSVLPIDKLEETAKQISKQTLKDKKEVYNNLLKQKAFISMVPFLFGIGVMGFFVVGMSRMFTKMRYNKSVKQEKAAQDELIKEKQTILIDKFLKNKI